MMFEDRTHINAPPEKIFEFFRNMEGNYPSFHPNHRLFRWEKGNNLQVGNEFYFEEVINGKLLKKRVRLTKVISDRYIEFVPTMWLMRLFLPRMSFEINEQENGCEFIAQIVLIAGPLARWLNRKEFAAVKQHMKEEGENLKRLMEITL